MERKLTKYLILISLILFTSQIFSQSQIKLLERAYKENSDSLMQIFFDNWKKDVPNIEYNESYIDDTTKALIEIYKLFYKEYPLNEIFSKAESSDANSQSIVNNITSTNLKSILLPNSLTVAVIENIWYFKWYEDPYWKDYEPDNSRRDTLKTPELARIGLGKILYKKEINNFRPSVNNKIVFIEPIYAGILNYFLYGKVIESLYTDFDKVKRTRSYNEFMKRFNFLHSYIPIYMTGPRYIIDDQVEMGGLNIGGPLSIDAIMIDSTLSFARVNLWTDCYETIVFIEKKNGEWILRKKEEICWCG